MSKPPLNYRVELRKAAALSLAVACASASAARNAVQDSDGLVSQNNGPADGNQTPEILRLEGGELVAATPPRLRNRFSVSYRPSFNITAEFRNIGFPATPLPGPGTGIVDRNYDDGYVRLETTGAAAGSPDGYTSYWSYESAAQVAGNDLLMHKALSTGMIGSSGSIDDDPRHGMEFTYSWEAGPVGRFFWGLEGSFGFSGVNIRDSRSLTSDINLVTDTYDISNLEPGGGPPPPPGTPSTGRSGTSAIILADPASRSTSAITGSTIDGYRDVDASVFDFRLGPYIEHQLSRRLSLSLSGGLGFALVDSSFSFHETLSLPGAGLLTHSGDGSNSELLVGGYAAANISYAVADAWRLFAGAQYRNLGAIDQSVNGADVHLDFGNAIYAAFGVGYSF